MKDKKSIKKITRNASKQNVKAEFIQVSYFNNEEGSFKMWRRKKYRETTPKQKRLNEKNAKRYFEALVEANFKGNRDFYITLTFDNDKYPENEQAAKRIVKNWIGRINYRRHKQGMENCKYIIVFEKSPRGRVHFHVLMDGQIKREIVEECWQHGFCNCNRLQSDPQIGLSKIISYLSKGQEDKKNSKRWIPSNGLIKPWITCNKNTKISKKKFNLLRIIPENAELFRDTIERDNPGYKLQSIERSICEETNQLYLFCRMRLKARQVKN